MRITCGSPVYVNGDSMGYVCGIRVDAVNDRVNGIVVGSGETSKSCYDFDFERIADATPERITLHASVNGHEPASRITCNEEQERMRYWLSTLVPDGSEAEPEISARFAVYSDREQGEFRLAGTREVELDGCGCGMLDSVEVDEQGFIDHVDVQVDEQTGAQIHMKPLAKRSPKTVVEAAQSMRTA